ncbi:MAG: hypothetical protein QW273_03395, partial [Candidatus Pacearchaeota archaeon]
MIKKFLLILALTYFLMLIKADSLKLSPLKAELFLKGEKECLNYFIEPDSDSLSIEIKWSKNKSNSFYDYYLLEDDVKIKSSIRKVKSGVYEICFYPKERGEYYGLVLFSRKEGLLGIGSFVKLSVEGNFSSIKTKNDSSHINLLTGRTVSNNEGNINYFLVFIFLVLFFILIILIFYPS